MIFHSRDRQAIDSATRLGGNVRMYVYTNAIFKHFQPNGIKFEFVLMITNELDSLTLSVAFSALFRFSVPFTTTERKPQNDKSFKCDRSARNN